MKGKQEMKKRKRHLQSNGINPKHFSKGQVKFWAYMIPISLIMLLPIIFIFMNAFKPADELFAYPPRFFVRHPTFDNFRNLFEVSSHTQIPVTRYLFNSVIAALVTVFGTILISVSAAFVFSKKRYRFSRIFFQMNNIALMFVSVAVSIPRYFVIHFIGVYDTFWANILPLLVIPTGIFLVKQFIDGIPDSLFDAAYIDGAGNFTIMHKIVLPLVSPAISTLTILAFQQAWNSVEASTNYITNETYKTFAYYVSTLTNTTGNIVAGAGISAAASLIMFLPNLILFIIVQSRVMNTMIHSGIK